MDSKEILSYTTSRRYAEVKLRTISSILSFALLLSSCTEPDIPTPSSRSYDFEIVPNDEAAQIADIAKKTKQLQNTRAIVFKEAQEGQKLRGVHPKSHGCVVGNFEINKDIAPNLKVGLFSKPGKQYKTLIRYSNASVRLAPDLENGENGSRGMAIKIFDVDGDMLVKDQGANNQDFLMINTPVFAFPNVRSYQRLTDALLASPSGADPRAAFKEGPDWTDEDRENLKKTLKTLGLIKSKIVRNPTEVQYFAAAPSSFGKERVMKFSAAPCNGEKTQLPFNDANEAKPNYLHEALASTMSQGENICFDFKVQLQTIDQVKKDRAKSDASKGDLIEDATREWDNIPFFNVAKITIPKPQTVDLTDSTQQDCKSQAFNPWHSLAEHRPLGGINRLRRPVYINSVDNRREGVLASGVVILDQGWNEDEMLDFYNTSQGSQLLPYSWFLALEQADNSDLFRDNKNIKRLGFISQDPISAGRNPDGLPIGFVKDDNPEDFLVPALTKRLSSSSQANQMEWLGLTCAACHTSEIEYGDKILRINGGPAQSDFPAFLDTLSKALAATTHDDAKLTRFAKKILAEGGYNETEKQALKTQLAAYTDWLNNYIDINYGGLTTPYGYGRLDAFGAILNRVTSNLLDIPSNGTPANAPVSYPFLWNTSDLDWVQWNGSVSNHIARNVGEVTGVFADTILKTDNDKERFDSSAKIKNLYRLEQLMAKLKSPKWGPPLPAIDYDKAEKGKVLYVNNCVGCHGIRDDNGQFPMTQPNAVGKQFIQTHLSPLETIGTDPLMAMNFVDPRFNVDPGPLRPYLDEKFRNDPKVPRGAVLSAVGKNIIGKQLAAIQPPVDEKQQLELSGYHLPDETPPINPPLAYKARPLNGIWSTAPYMHNGSMANLYQTLLPDNERETSFYVGSKKFDPQKVGFESNQQGNHFLFKTVDDKGVPIPGNSNKGHSGNSFTKTRGEDGQWRDFTDEERYQLIEYMKTL